MDLSGKERVILNENWHLICICTRDNFTISSVSTFLSSPPILPLSLEVNCQVFVVTEATLACLHFERSTTYEIRLYSRSAMLLMMASDMAVKENNGHD